MTENVGINLIENGKEALGRGDTLSALGFFEKALDEGQNPTARSYFAFCIAKDRGLTKRGIAWCEENLRLEPENPVHYLNLGRIYLLMKKREEAIRSFRDGLKLGPSDEIAKSVVETADGGYALVGFVGSEETWPRSGDIWLAKIESEPPTS